MGDEIMTEITEQQIREDIGTRIYVQRYKAGLSQKELATAIGVSGQMLHKYENGSSNITSQKLLLCAKALNKPVGYFYGDGEDDEMQTTSNILRIAAELDQLPPEGVDTIVDMMRNITRMAELCAEVERRKGLAA